VTFIFLTYFVIFTKAARERIKKKDYSIYHIKIFTYEYLLCRCSPNSLTSRLQTDLRERQKT